MKISKYIIISLGFLIAISGFLLLLKYLPILEAHYYNREINIAGIKLLMTEEELNSSLEEKSEFVPGMGGDGWRFKEEKIFAMISSVGLFKDKVAAIDTENPAHSVLGVSVGEDYEQAVSTLQKKGFKKSSRDVFCKGNFLIQLNGGSKISSIRIIIQDPAYKNVQF
jgi:hypothetical protein